MVQPSDDDLLDAARSGDAEALETLLLRHQARIYRFGMRLCRDPEDAKDVLQDTLITMARSVRDFQGRSSLSTWLYTVARSLCIKKRRRSKFAPEREEALDAAGVAEVADSAPQPDEVASSRQVAGALESSIRSLPTEQREVLVLRDVEGLKATEVAEVLGLSVAAVKSRLHRGRLAVREAVASALGTGPLAAPDVGCPDVLAMYSKHVEGEISPDLCATMERHLETCGRCRGACDSLKQTLAICRATPEIRVPEATQASVRAALRDWLHSR